MPKGNELHCRIYSYPYMWISYGSIRNNFRGGLFKSVLEISLIDERPFEHDFFSSNCLIIPIYHGTTLHNGES